jgi:hypothetical protein
MRGRVVAVIAVVISLLVLRPSGQEPPRVSSRTYVPIESSVEPLAQPTRGGNAVLRVRFAKGNEPPIRVRYATEYGPVTLADDGQGFDARAGDGLYTALGTIDLAATRERLGRLSGSPTAMPARTWRERSKIELDARVDPRLWQLGRKFPFEPWGDPAAISTSHSLLVRDLGVIEDPTRTKASCGQTSMGVWSFGYLMEQIANSPATGVTGPQFVRAWLDRWMTAQPVNGGSYGPRTLMQSKILDPWIAASGGPGMPLDLSKAPFRLLAIVNRLDLRQQAAYGGTSGGELRFVFMHVPFDCTNGGRPFEVILEFGLPVSGCLGLWTLANQWKALDALPLGSPSYNAALEAITQEVVVANAAPFNPNGSLLNQIRTNENWLDHTGEGLDWELREFRIDPATHHLFQDTVAQTPYFYLRSTPVIANYVNDQPSAIKAGNYTVPLRYPTAADAFRAGGVVYGLGSFWDDFSGTPIVDREARHKFSLNTCNGCHTGETHGFFTHVGATPFGTLPALSDFMSGGWANDPADLMPARFFDELERRAVDLDALLNTSCLLSPLDVPVFSISH